MVEFRTLLILTNSLIFVAVGLTLLVRVKEAKGSLRLAKISVVVAALCSASAFMTETVEALNYENELLIKQLYVFEDLFAMLVLAFLASFALLATYNNPRRNLIIILFFLMALIPPLYLSLNYNLAIVMATGLPETYNFTAPPLTHILYAFVGIPLGLVPILAFARSYMNARKRGDKILGQRAGIMFSAVALNEAMYLIYVFGGYIVEIASLIIWIPVAFYLLFAVLRITSPVEPKA
jgi:hypothetical protein